MTQQEWKELEAGDIIRERSTDKMYCVCAKRERYVGMSCLNTPATVVTRYTKRPEAFDLIPEEQPYENTDNPLTTHHHRKPMTPQEWNTLKPGDIIRNIYNGEQHCVTSSRFTSLLDNRTMILAPLNGAGTRSANSPVPWELVKAAPEHNTTKTPMTLEQWEQLTPYDRVILRETGEVCFVELSSPYSASPPRRVLMRSILTDKLMLSSVPSKWALLPREILQDVQTDHPCVEPPPSALSSRTRSGVDESTASDASPQYQWVGGDCEDAANYIRHGVPEGAGDLLPLRWLLALYVFMVWASVCIVYQTWQSAAWLWALVTGGAR